MSTETTEEFGVQTEGVEEEKSAKMKELEDAHKVVKEVSPRKLYQRLAPSEVKAQLRVMVKLFNREVLASILDSNKECKDSSSKAVVKRKKRRS